MKQFNVYSSRFLYQSCKFGLWVGFFAVGFIIESLGFLLGKLGGYLNNQLPMFGQYWTYLSLVKYRLCMWGSSWMIFAMIVYALIFLVAKIFGVRLIKSKRFTNLLHNMLMTSVDKVPMSDVDKRDKAKNIVNQKANKAVKKSFALWRKKEMLLFVYMPRQVQVREILNKNLNEVANEISRFTGLTSGNWEDIQGNISLLHYRVMIFKR